MDNPGCLVFNSNRLTDRKSLRHFCSTLQIPLQVFKCHTASFSKKTRYSCWFCSHRIVTARQMFFRFSEPYQLKKPYQLNLINGKKLMLANLKYLVWPDAANERDCCISISKACVWWKQWFTCSAEPYLIAAAWQLVFLISERDKRLNSWSICSSPKFLWVLQNAQIEFWWLFSW